MSLRVPRVTLLRVFAARVPDDCASEYSSFWRLWRQRKYFACHEELEVLWRRESGERKRFYHGLIHCAVALVQVERANVVGANRQVVRAQVKLSPFAPEYLGVDIEALLQFVEKQIAPLTGVLSLQQRAILEKSLEKLKLSLEKK